MSERQQPQQDEAFVSKNLVNLQLYAPAPADDARSSNLQWGSYRGNPNITVWTGLNGDKKPIQARMDLLNFGMLVKGIEDIVAGKVNRVIVENDTIDKKVDPDNKTRSHQSTTVAGRDSEGLIWISVLEEGRPKIVFHFKLPDWHRISFDGKPLDPKTASEQAALIYIRLIQRAFEQTAFEWKDRQRLNDRAGVSGKPKQQTKMTKNDDAFFDDLPI